VSVDQRLRAVVAAVLGVDGTALADGDSPETIQAWDSVAHMQLVMALEAEFGVEFDPGEIGELVSVGALRARLNGVAGEK
jgi:acyl carrier protein